MRKMCSENDSSKLAAGVCDSNVGGDCVRMSGGNSGNAFCFLVKFLDITWSTRLVFYHYVCYFHQTLHLSFVVNN